MGGSRGISRSPRPEGSVGSVTPQDQCSAGWAPRTSRGERKMIAVCLKFITIALATTTLLVTSPALAHPDDEICAPNSGLDPALCRQLSALDAAEPSTTILRTETGEAKTSWQVARDYGGIGTNHILPDGTDHILFVLALFLGAAGWQQLVWHISLFTLAHTATLGLAAAGVISPPASIVEPLIAASIAFVAIENVFWRGSSRWRPFVIFAFGLIHGMGFAGFFGSLGLPPGQFWPGLIGFNIGVEVGQLAVVAFAAWLALAARPVLQLYGFSDRSTVTVPLSLAIGAVGLWWAAERVVVG